MKITAFETIPLKIPFSVGGPAGSRSAGWNTLEMVVLRLETDNGLVGWGDAFSYHCSTSVQAALDTMVKPLVMGR
ncbi:MAG: mandelate racemase/muconate lactonizing enzyme family protein, partial [Candidatus Competibacteraceae bacterium]|nr:mandelate racemase/muconate lactonizing enzyme family protein [Candidatus Competibacteraceae bacterium]